MKDYSGVIRNLDFQLRRSHHLTSRIGGLKSKLEELRKEERALERRIGVIELSKVFFGQAVDLLHKESMGELEEVVNQALEYVFSDKRYVFHIKTADERGLKSLEFCISQEVLGEVYEIGIKDGVGAGIRTIISFVVHFYTLVRQKLTPVLFIDEGYTQVSSEYLERLFFFIKTLAKEKGFSLILITHDDRLVSYADRIYRIKDGRIV